MRNSDFHYVTSGKPGTVNGEFDSEFFQPENFGYLHLPILENTIIVALYVLSIPQNINHEKAETETQISKWLKNNAECQSQDLLSGDNSN